jgi:hypothetical protein
MWSIRSFTSAVKKKQMPSSDSTSRTAVTSQNPEWVRVVVNDDQHAALLGQCPNDVIYASSSVTSWSRRPIWVIRGPAGTSRRQGMHTAN